MYGGTYSGLYYYDSFLKTSGRSNDFEVIGCKNEYNTCGKSCFQIQNSTLILFL